MYEEYPKEIAERLMALDIRKAEVISLETKLNWAKQLEDLYHDAFPFMKIYLSSCFDEEIRFVIHTDHFRKLSGIINTIRGKLLKDAKVEDYGASNSRTWSWDGIAVCGVLVEIIGQKPDDEGAICRYVKIDEKTEIVRRGIYELVCDDDPTNKVLA